MPKQPSEAQIAARKKFGAAAKARAEAKRAQKPISPTQANSDNADIGELLRRIKELETRLQPQGPQVNNRGSLVGTFEKYITDPDYYPSPIERLAQEARLQRFAFKDNFELDFNIGLSAYETKDGVNTKEPKFTLKLVRIMYDDETGEPTDNRYVACQMIFHEDPGTAIIIARENGVSVDDYGEKQFLDEMRYLRMRDWLLECFYPPAPVAATDKKEMVIGNRLVEVYTVNSEKSQSMAKFFAASPKKL